MRIQSPGTTFYNYIDAYANGESANQDVFNRPLAQLLESVLYLANNAITIGPSGAAAFNHTHTGVYEPVISPKLSAFNVDFGTATNQAARGDHTHAGVYEPVIATKNTGFNLNVATVLDIANNTLAGKLARADDSRLSNARTPLAHTHAVTDLQIGNVSGDGWIPYVQGGTFTLQKLTDLIAAQYSIQWANIQGIPTWVNLSQVQQLKAWTSAEAYESLMVSYDPSTNAITTATVLWPDGSSGIFTTLVVNSSYNTVDSFQITHAASGKTVTQPTVTRDGQGNVTAKPALTVA